VSAAAAASRGGVGRCGGVCGRRHASPLPPPMHKAAVAASGGGDAAVGGRGWRVVGAPGWAHVRGGSAVSEAAAKSRGCVGRCGGVGRRRHASPLPPPMHKATVAARGGGDVAVGGCGWRPVGAGGGRTCWGGVRCQRRRRQAAAAGGDSDGAAAAVLVAMEMRAAGAGGGIACATSTPGEGRAPAAARGGAAAAAADFAPAGDRHPARCGAVTADGGRDSAAATWRRCLGAAGRRRATAGRRWPWPAARWRAAPAARWRRGAPPQHVPLVWLVACQSLIGTKLDQQICIRQIVLKHMPEISGKCVSHIMPETGQTG